MGIRNWSGNVAYSTDDVARPTSIDELQEIVSTSRLVRALGTRHSFSTVADTTGTLVSVRDLDLRIEVDTPARTATVPAGVRYGELAGVLEAHGLALPNLGSLPHISVAGACATGTHGSGDANRCLADAVLGLEYVGADGSLRHVQRGEPDFAGSVVSLGALGVTTRLTLALEPSYAIRQDVWLDAPVATVAEQLDDVLSAGYSVSVFSAFRDPARVDAIWVKSRTDADATPAASDVADATRWGARAARTAQHPIAGEDTSAATEQLGRAGRWFERLPHFRLEFTPSVGDEQQSEFLVPRAAGGTALARIARLGLGDTLQVFELRSVAGDEQWLSPCHGRDTVALHFTWVNDDARVRRALDAVQGALAGIDARPHWGKVFTLPAETVRARYPEHAAAAELAARVDPERTFGNAFLERFLY